MRTTKRKTVSRFSPEKFPQSDPGRKNDDSPTELVELVCRIVNQNLKAIEEAIFQRETFEVEHIGKQLKDTLETRIAGCAATWSVA